MSPFPTVCLNIRVWTSVAALDLKKKDFEI